MDTAIARTQRSLVTLLEELVNGAHAAETYVLNRSDPGLLASLDHISADDASRVPNGRTSSIAAHVDHLRYGISLLNRWAGGENPFADADYSESWRRIAVNDSQWAELRASLRHELAAWAQNIARPRELDHVELTGMVGSVVHLAYHLGAMRQIAPASPDRAKALDRRCYR